MKGLLVHTTGLVEEVEFPEVDKLGWFYDVLQCDLVDFVRPYGLEEVAEKYGLQSLLGKFCMVVDDEGFVKDKPQINPIASIMYGYDKHGQPLFGDVLIAKDEETDDGIETVGLTDGELMLMKASINGLIAMHNEKAGDAHG